MKITACKSSNHRASLLTLQPVGAVSIGTHVASAATPIRTATKASATKLGAAKAPAKTPVITPAITPAKTAEKTALKPSAKPPKKPLEKSGSNATVVLTITTVDFLKSDVAISVPVGTKAKKIVDNPATVLTFPDGAQMTISPDASSFGDYKKNIVEFEKTVSTPAPDRTIFVVEKPDRLIYSDNSGPGLTKRTVFVMQKKLPTLIKNELLAIGMLCSDTGLQEETLAPNRASIDLMMAACDTITAAK
jgi:hypothetical protein